jgi:DNA-binding response OmpR family regulator
VPLPFFVEVRSVIQKDLYSTGEAATLLNISRSTISRKFDRGVLSGKKNPITGERLISRESLVAFVDHYKLLLEKLDIEEKKKNIFLGTSDDSLLSLLELIFKEDKRVELKRWSHGGDLLLECSRNPPDLLVIDQELSDIPAEVVIQSLRRQQETKRIKMLCFVEKNNINRCLEWGANEGLTKDGACREELGNRLYSFLQFSEKHEEMPQAFEHQRMQSRTIVRFPAKIELYRVKSPYQRYQGQATVVNIGIGGAYLSGITFEGGRIPCEPFRIVLETEQEPLGNWRAHCKVIRFQSNEVLTAGVQFLNLSESSLEMIQTLLHRAPTFSKNSQQDNKVAGK